MWSSRSAIDVFTKNLAVTPPHSTLHELSAPLASTALTLQNHRVLSRSGVPTLAAVTYTPSGIPLISTRLVISKDGDVST